MDGMFYPILTRIMKYFSCSSINSTYSFKGSYERGADVTLIRLPNDPMLNIWLNMRILLNEENNKSGYVMQRPMFSYVCGINLR